MLWDFGRQNFMGVVDIFMLYASILTKKTEHGGLK
jgi:hypothetical protein